MTVELDHETERLVRHQVQAGHATSAEELVNLAIRAYVCGQENAAVQEDAESRRERRLAAANRIRELRQNLALGPGLTIRDLIEEGRRW